MQPFRGQTHKTREKPNPRANLARIEAVVEQIEVFFDAHPSPLALTIFLANLANVLVPGLVRHLPWPA